MQKVSPTVSHGGNVVDGPARAGSPSAPRSDLRFAAPTGQEFCLLLHAPSSALEQIRAGVGRFPPNPGQTAA